MALQHSNHDDEHGSTTDYWDSYPTTVEPVEADLYEDIQPDLDGWDDIDGLDIDGYSGDESVLIESVAWLHSLLYSDYADASDDDDRPAMDIPRSVIDRSTGGVF